MSIKELIDKMDGNTDLIQMKLDGIYVWPLVRFDVIQALINDQANLDEPNDRVSRRSKVDVLRELARSIKISIPLFFAREIKYLFFTNELSTIESGNGLFHNRVSEYFFDLVKDDALIIEYSTDFTIRPRLHQRIISRAVLSLEEKVRGFFERRRDYEIELIIQDIIRSIGETFPDFNKRGQDLLVDKLRAKLNFRGVLKTYKRFLKQKRPEIIFVEDAHYGGRAALLTMVAKLQGIKVAEPQHGFVNENHPSYNFGSLIQAHEDLPKYYPDYLLTYGSFWSNSIHVPNKTVEIGNPHLSNSIQSFSCPSSEQMETILISGSGVSVKETNQLLSRLALKYPACEVIYRPHPMERKLVEDRYWEAIKAGVVIDNSQNVYESIVKADLVISELSTVLFESIAFKRNTRLFMSSYTRAYYSDSLKYLNFFEVDDLDDLFYLNEEMLEQAYKYYWIDDWEYAFREFLINFAKN